jgi:hypothetical protein
MKTTPNQFTLRQPLTDITNPKVKVNISLEDTNLRVGNKIILNITLTNATPTNQKLLFDKPSLSTGGPWETCAVIINNKTQKSVVEVSNKQMLSSQISYTTEGCYYNLLPKQSISRKFAITDIVVLNTDDYTLPKGSYTIQLFYYQNMSNSLIFTIR